jgi:ribosomal protein S18 acetylase RimI-like enzyme
MTIITALPEDAAAILELQKLAYRSEAAMYDDYSIAPLVQTLDELKTEFASKTVLKALLDERLVGSVRGWQKGGTCYVERLIVHPDVQGQGIGTKLVGALEAAFPDAKRFELFTGHKSERNLRLYGKLGYQVFKQQRISDRLSFTYLEKRK